MSHLESLIAEFYDWRGYLVKRNVRVGRRLRGGWDMELDVVAFHPHTKHLVHVEASLGAHSWKKRELRFAKKFRLGKKYMFKEVFTWLAPKTSVDRIAVIVTHPKNRNSLGGAKIVSIDESMFEVRTKVSERGIAAKDGLRSANFAGQKMNFAPSGFLALCDEGTEPGYSREQMLCHRLSILFPSKRHERLGRSGSTYCERLRL
jgi:hypothetical protein